jgi:predicted NAD-dependent protein-ADP-ribosyltransferase YbiA (DUF1768 family)
LRAVEKVSAGAASAPPAARRAPRAARRAPLAHLRIWQGMPAQRQAMGTLAMAHSKAPLPMLPGPAPRSAPRLAHEDRLLKELPKELDEPMFYLSRLQRSVVVNTPGLAGYADQLPGWVPHRVIAVALGKGTHAIDAAMDVMTKRPYVWAPEFENVHGPHSKWYYIERPLRVKGRVYNDVERFYEAQKPEPFDAKKWEEQRLGAMVEAVEAKLMASPDVVELLESTHDHPLLFMKRDEVWGWTPQYYTGHNMLARIYDQYRALFREQRAAIVKVEEEARS